MAKSCLLVCLVCLAGAAAADVPTPTAADLLDVGGSKIYYETFGEGPVLVLIHDGLVHRETWDAQIAVLAAGHRVVRYDRRGYGRSEQPTAAYSNVDDLERLLDHLGVARAVLIGSSSGGGLAVDFALAHPRRVAALVLAGAVVDGLGYSFHMTLRGLANFSPDVEERIARWVDDPYLVAPANTAAKQRLRELLRAHQQNLDPAKHRYQRAHAAEHPAGEASLGRLHEITVPTLIVSAAQDIPDVHAHAGALEAGIAGARRVVIPDAGHLVYMERPEAFNQAVLEFLSLISLRLDDVPSFERGFAPARGTHLYYEALGKGHPLVLIHGGLLDHRMWDDQFGALAASFRVIRYDARAHGLSKAAIWPHSDHEDLNGLLEHLGIGRAHVMGLSLGGRIAVDFALEYPEKVGALIPVSSGLSGYELNGEDLSANREALRAAWRRGDLAGFLEAFQRSWTDGHRAPDAVDPAVRERVRAMAAATLHGPSSSGEGLPPAPPAVDRLEQIRTPTLIVLGSLDMTDIHTISDLMTDHIESARRVEIADVAHMVNMEKPEELNRTVVEFLSGIASE